MRRPLPRRRLPATAPRARSLSSTSTARCSTSGRSSRSRSGRPGTSAPSSTGAVSALEVRFDEGVGAGGHRVRRGQAHAAAHDATVEDLRADVGRRHRLGDRGRARADARHGRRRARRTTSSSSSTRATSRSSARARRLIQAELWCDGDTLGFKTRGNRYGHRGHARAGQPPPHGRVPRRPRPPAHEGRRQRLRRLAAGDDRRGGRSRASSQAESSGGKSGPEVLERAFGERALAARARRAARERRGDGVGEGRDAPAQPLVRDRRRRDARHARPRRRQQRRRCSASGARSRATATTPRGSATPTTSTSAIARTSRPSARRWPRGRVTLMPRQDGDARRYFGVYPAIVTDIVDTESLGRIEVKFPWLGPTGADDVRAWATLVSPYADDDQGLEILPERRHAGRRRLRGRRPRAGRTSSAPAGTASSRCPRRPRRRTTSGCCKTPQREQARVRRHRGRRQGHRLDAERPQGRARRLRPAGDGQSQERVHDRRWTPAGRSRSRRTRRSTSRRRC